MDNKSQKGLNKKTIIVLSLLFFLFCIFIAWLIIAIFQGNKLGIIFAYGQPLHRQIFWGALFGVAAGVLSLFLLLRASIFANLRSLFEYIITEACLTPVNILLISLLAGISEEILFRGAIQPLIGIWWSSLLFISLHGYFNPWNWRTSIYGLLMFAISVGLGILYARVGLYAAICAHTIVDIVILMGLHNGLMVNKCIKRK